jgi:glycosyltransferase involved in cell wall biosynthesis
MNNRADLYILTDFDFSYRNSAAYSRMLNYATLYTRNERSKCYISNIGADYVNRKKIYEGVFIDNPGVKTPLNKLYRIFKTHINFAEVLKYLRISFKFANNNSPSKVFLVHTGGFSMTLMALLYLKVIKKSKVIYEKNEIVIGIALNTEFSGIFNYIPIRYFFKLPIIIFSILVDVFTIFYSGIIVISTRLEKLYKHFNIKTQLIPILVSDEFFKIEEPKKHNGGVLIFSSTGGILPKKEGIEEFLLILNKLKAHEIEFQYNIYGDAPSKFLSKFLKKISDLNLEENVSIKGYIPHDEIKNVLTSSDFLVLTRPKNIQNNFGFSTKLAEFLASGKPVILTDISDNCKYLTDKVNSIFIDFNDINSSVSKIIKLTENKSSLVEIGIAAREKTKEFFHNQNYTDKFSSLINE